MIAMTPEMLPEGVEQDSPWPYEWSTLPHAGMPTGPWTLGMSAGGSVVLWPTDKRFPEDLGLITITRGDRGELERFQTMFCRLGYGYDERHIHQSGTIYIFNWRSFTLAQVYAAQQVADLFLNGDVGGAWEAGRAFEMQIGSALTKAQATM